jgi:hypothetical protein
MRIFFRNLRERYGVFGLIVLLFTIIFSIISFVFSVYLIIKLSSFYIIADKNSLNIEDTGNVGEYVGGVLGTILNVVTIFLLVLTIKLQSRELGIQIEETRRANDEIENQRFETNFFNLLNIQRLIVIDIEYTEDNYGDL